MFEKVSKSHPDKICDRVAGALVDLAYKKNIRPKIAVEVLIGHGVCHIIAETSVKFTKAEVKEIRQKALEIKSDKADKVGYEAAQLLYSTADEYSELKDYENSYNYYVKAFEAFDDVYNNVSAKRQAALDAIERAKHKADNVDEFAAEADKIAPLSTEDDSQGEE